jgi:hypothetical protein
MFGTRDARFLARVLAVVAAAAAAGWGIFFAAHRDRGTGSSTPEMAPPARTQPAAPQLPQGLRWTWSLDKVMKRIDLAGIRLGGRVTRVHPATTLCSGVGAPVSREGVRRWSVFDCTFTTFRHGIDRDLEFRVSVVSSREFAIGQAHWIGEQR